MINGSLTESISYEPPQNYNSKNVIFWEETSNALRLAQASGDKHARPLLTKAKKFIDSQCVDQISQTSWKCKPLKAYNKTEYLIRETDQGMVCNCQGFKKAQKNFDEGHSDIKPICSHVVAVKQFCFLEAKKNA